MNDVVIYKMKYDGKSKYVAVHGSLEFIDFVNAGKFLF